MDAALDPKFGAQLLALGLWAYELGNLEDAAQALQL
jgi:hypothetical protein